ncbi:hypothetical protein DICVIV_01887 [Dictyocaulus viviparus]|uniref:PPM-type phosphatase domain-containing protein n=1 Tax=Dictyocaulus viviparus TaxID=29172 RepID=A0A0D8YBH8_DICVI|nr:hypothetical protein DICVIV_01887 [Dictyocaulus viviparus]
MSAVQSKRKSVVLSLYSEADEKPPAKKFSGGLYDSGDEEGSTHSAEKAVDASSFRCSENNIINEAVLNVSYDGKEKGESDLEPLQLLSVLGCRRGEREDMQDAHLLLEHFECGLAFVKRCALYAIFDGHAGSRAARYCEKHIPTVLSRKLSSYNDVKLLEKHLKRIFTETFKTIDEGFLAEARKM